MRFDPGTSQPKSYSVTPPPRRGGKTCFDLLHGIGALGTTVCHRNCSVLDCIGKESDVPNFDLNVSTSSGERLWVNISTVIFHNQRTGERLLVHLAHDITEQKKQDEVVRQVLTLSKEAQQLGRENRQNCASLSTVNPGN